MLTTYYTSMTAVSCVALFVLSVLVHENGRLPSSTKKKFYLTYAAIALSALAEWGSVALNGAPENTIILHAFVKSLEDNANLAWNICMVANTVIIETDGNAVLFMMCSEAKDEE